ncbi:MAG: hypothetical protein WC787_03795 [Patescibacteria group bacterium]
MTKRRVLLLDEPDPRESGDPLVLRLPRKILQSEFVRHGIRPQTALSVDMAINHVLEEPDALWFILTNLGRTFSTSKRLGMRAHQGEILIRVIRGTTPSINAHIVLWTGGLFSKEEALDLGADAFFEKTGKVTEGLLSEFRTYIQKTENTCPTNASLSL